MNRYVFSALAAACVWAATTQSVADEAACSGPTIDQRLSYRLAFEPVSGGARCAVTNTLE